MSDTPTAFDFTGLTIEQDAMPSGHGGRGKPARYQENPFLPFVVDSWNAGQGDRVKGGRSMTLPKLQVKDALYLLRQAAASQNLGISIAVTLPDSVKRLSDDEIKAFSDRKNLKVRFCAKPKRKYTPKEESAPADNQPTETPAQ